VNQPKMSTKAGRNKNGVFRKPIETKEKQEPSGGEKRKMG